MAGRASTVLGASVLALVSLAGALAQTPAAPTSGAAAFITSPPGATACLGCHGPEATALPSLARLSARDIETALAEFREDKREPTLMNRIAKGFTAEESKAIAEWLAAHAGKAP
ncbi:MAG: cytochrome [Hyphomicrobiales bacterium]|jgi:cytochrome c553|nr:cytochrome [Hyphomicrobiales bacterium]